MHIINVCTLSAQLVRLYASHLKEEEEEEKKCLNKRRLTSTVLYEITLIDNF